MIENYKVVATNVALFFTVQNWSSSFFSQAA